MRNGKSDIFVLSVTKTVSGTFRSFIPVYDSLMFCKTLKYSVDNNR